MKTWMLLIGLGLATSGLGQGKENPGSLFETAKSDPYLAPIARAVGDLLTVHISEQSVASYAADTQADKQDSSGIETAFFNDFLDRIFRPITTAGNSTVSGSGNTSQNAQMTARMTVVVVEVMPNGILVVEGRRTLVTNKDTQTLVLSGLVRPLDIRPDNTIDSLKVAEAEIRMEGQGMIADRQRKGILTQILDWLF